jgi:hypothetical protein
MNTGSLSAGPRVRWRVSQANRSPRIALSYRRDDSLAITGRLYDRLRAVFGKENVFMDLDSIAAGADFREQISQTIGRTDLVIAIIGPKWAGPREDSTNRINDAGDIVRLEIASALTQQIPIIPLLVNNTPMPPPSHLPPEIRELAFRNALPLDSGLDFHVHVDRLLDAISKFVRPPPEHRPQHSPLHQWQTKTVVAVVAGLTAVLAGWGIWLAMAKQHRPISRTTSPTPVERTTSSESSTTAAPAATTSSGAEPASANQLDMALTAPPATSSQWSDPVSIPVGMQCYWESQRNNRGQRRPLYVLVNGTRTIYWDGRQPSLGVKVQRLEFRSANDEPVIVTYRLVPLGR